MVLAAATATALLFANSPAAGAYEALWQVQISLGPGPVNATESMRAWINDGLMAVFFFVIGLEIKRELVTGHLSEPGAALMPVLAAAGGVVVPALIFLGLTHGTGYGDGWGIPIATDVVFAIGVLTLLGTRVPVGAKLYLLAIAVVDDVLAITVIAVAYSERISPGWLAVACGGLLAVVALRVCNVGAISAYAVPAGVVWMATFASGVHTTVAGVVLGLLVPARPVNGRAVLELLQRRLHPFAAFAVVPLFALANAGIAVSYEALGTTDAMRLAGTVAVSLFVGKIVGVAGITFLATRFRLGSLPEGVGTREVWGLAAVAGIGFTVSLFMAELSYDSSAVLEPAKLGIFCGSLTAALVGSAILYPRRLTMWSRQARSTRRSHMPRRLLASVVALVVIPIGVEWLISFIKDEPYHIGRAVGVLAAIALIIGLIWAANATSRPLNLAPRLVLVVLGVLVTGVGSVELIRDHGPEAGLAATLLGLAVAGVAGYMIYIERTGADFRLAVPKGTRAGAVQLIEGDRETAVLTRFSTFSASDEEVARLCLVHMSADDVHFIGYYVDGKCRFHLDVLDSPTLNRFFRGDDRDQRRLVYERTGRQLDWVMSKLNMYVRRLDGGILIRTVLDVEQGALYHYWIDRNVYLTGITVDQSKVLVADEKLRRLANAIGHLPRGGTYPTGLTQQVVTADE